MNVGWILMVVDGPTPFQTVCYPTECRCQTYYRDVVNGTCTSYTVELLYREKKDPETFVIGEVTDSYVCPSDSAVCWVKNKNPTEIFLVPSTSNLKESGVFLIQAASYFIWPIGVISLAFD